MVMNLSLCIGAQPSLYLPPRSNHFPANGKFHPTRVSMQLQPLSQNKFHSFKAVGTGGVHPLVKKGFGFGSKSKRSVFACNAALNAKCSQGQTQTVTRKSQTITQAPTHGKEKSPKLDDGGSGFPPRDDGGGGGGGGGGESFSDIDKSSVLVLRLQQGPVSILYKANQGLVYCGSYIPAEEIPVQYGGLKRDDDTEFSNEAVSEAFIKPGSSETIEIPAPQIEDTLVWDRTKTESSS